MSGGMASPNLARFAKSWDNNICCQVNDVFLCDVFWTSYFFLWIVHQHERLFKFQSIQNLFSFPSKANFLLSLSVFLLRNPSLMEDISFYISFCKKYNSWFHQWRCKAVPLHHTTTTVFKSSHFQKTLVFPSIICFAFWTNYSVRFGNLYCFKFVQ